MRLDSESMEEALSAAGTEYNSTMSLSTLDFADPTPLRQLATVLRCSLALFAAIVIRL